jgi:hypothetical protein
MPLPFSLHRPPLPLTPFPFPHRSFHVIAWCRAGTPPFSDREANRSLRHHRPSSGEPRAAVTVVRSNTDHLPLPHFLSACRLLPKLRRLLMSCLPSAPSSLSHQPRRLHMPSATTPQAPLMCLHRDTSWVCGTAPPCGQLYRHRARASARESVGLGLPCPLGQCGRGPPACCASGPCALFTVGPCVEAGPLAFKFFFTFLNISKSLQVQFFIDLNSSQKILK